MRARKATQVATDTPQAITNRRSSQPGERSRGVWGLAGSPAHTFEDSPGVGISGNSLRCQPPRFSLDQRVYSTGEYCPVLPSTPQAVVPLDAELIALLRAQPDIVQARVRLACPGAHLLSLLINPVLSLGVVVRLVQILEVQVDDHLLKVVTPDHVECLLQLRDVPELLDDRIPSGPCVALVLAFAEEGQNRFFAGVGFGQHRLLVRIQDLFQPLALPVRSACG